MKKETTIKRITEFSKKISDNILADSVLMNAEYFWSKDHVPYSQRTEGEYQLINEGEIWGHCWDSAWFRLKGEIPPGWQGEKIVAHLDFGGEALVYDNNDNMLQGLSNGSVFDHDFSRDIVHLITNCNGSESIELWVETAANGLFGMFTEPDPEVDTPNRYGHYDAKVNSIKLCVFDEDLWHLWLDFRILKGLIKTLPEKSSRVAQLIKTADVAIDAYLESRNNLDSCKQALAAGLYQPSLRSELSVLAVGHAHIDTAWLWPVRESIRKCARTFSSQLALIEKYPDYIFGASQPQHYQFVKDHYPDLYDRIKEAVKAGRWEPQGGMWVEADCNLISGESMIRQILHGKNFFMDEFGIDVDNLWLPDVFGYSAAMPQILKNCGINYFLTQKLSWNQYNQHPYHTFKWQGIDGSKVLTHFPPENNYNSQLDSEYLVPGRDNFNEKEYLDEFISLFGVGDGGGGPKEENIETGLRLADLEGAPKVRFGMAKDFFDRLRKNEDKLKTWVGELYLELHRGTFTTQAKVKKANRKLEYKLKALEFLYSCLPLDIYPCEELSNIWKKLMINQFHDILPGSSITKVYEVTHAEYNVAFNECENLQNQLVSDNFEKDPNSLVLFNYLHYHYTRPLELPEDWRNRVVKDQAGNIIPVQNEFADTKAQITIPPYSFITLTKGNDLKSVQKTVNQSVLENDYVCYEFGRDATILRAWDKETNKEILEVGQKGNQFSLYDDHPKNWDAWDIDIEYENCLLEHAKPIKLSGLTDGHIRKGIHFKLAIGKSFISQNIYLSSNSKGLDFETSVSWHEKHKMLRVAFPANVRSEKATFDIQYGYVKRNTHRNTSWDMAKFEVVAHRYVDLSDEKYGVALLNDCKYGHKVLHNVIDLNLLRSPTYPDPDADQGDHEFKYTLLPHTENFLHSDVIAHSACFNQEPLLMNGYRIQVLDLPLKVEGDGLSLEALKKSEKEDCLIARIVETFGQNSCGRIIMSNPKWKISECDMMEWTELNSIDNKENIEVTLKPFEIRTFKIWR
jgi:alpha-mannosidase